MELRGDHVALNLPTTPLISPLISSTTNRKSFRRYWNQLPRLKRNLIIIVLAAILVTLLLILPGGSNPTVNEIKNNNIQNNGDDEVEYPKENTLTKSSEKEKLIPIILPINNNQLPPPNNEIEHENKIDAVTSLPELPDSNQNKIDNSNEHDNINAVNTNNNEIDELVNRIDPNNNDVPKDFKGPTNERQHAVVNAFKHSWKGYKEFAWGHDNLKPVSMSSYDWFGLGLTIVDSLDTMYIMDLQEEFDEARNWIEQYLLFDINRDVNLFEVTIRVLGGLLSTYHLSGDKMFLKKSLELGNRLLPCFESPSGIPYSDVNLAEKTAHSPKWSPDSSTSEVTTLQLEFRDLSRSSGNKLYEKVIQRVNDIVHSLEKSNGLVPIFINANTGSFRNFATISLGARGDSYYEYLLKQWLQTGRNKNDYLIEDYMKAIEGVLTQLVRKTPKEHLTYVGELLSYKDFKPKMDHLTCYLPGTLILGYKFGMPESHFKLAKELLETCYQTYVKQPTGLAPEITYFNTGDNTADPDIVVKLNDAHNLQRPEFIESLYYFYAITGNKTYQDMGWTVFQSFEKFTKVKNGYTSIGNVKNLLNTRPRDMMESFWLGETLKYFYLLFSDDTNEIDLNKYVFNTEAHPLPIRNN